MLVTSSTKSTICTLKVNSKSKSISNSFPITLNPVSCTCLSFINLKVHSFKSTPKLVKSNISLTESPLFTLPKFNNLSVKIPLNIFCITTTPYKPK